MMRNFNRALAEWRSTIGSNHVVTDPKNLMAAQTATFKTSQQIPALIRPGNRVEVQECLRIANKYKTSVYPISRGKNWGYGSGVPVLDGCVVMELTRMNRIVDFDEKLAYVTVEPGVTFRQLNAFLNRKKSKLVIAYTGSTLDSSIIGNAVERGVGIGPKGDRFAHVCGFEVVLPAGDCIHTGFESFRKAKAARIGRWGIGPHLDGMFTQSNLGVITKMTAWLSPLPKYLQALHFQLNDNRRLGAVIDTLQRLSLEGLLQPTFNMWNVYRSLSAFRQYPWMEANERTPLPKTFVRAAKRQFGAWNGNVWLHSHGKEHGQVMRKVIREAMKAKVDKLSFHHIKKLPLDLEDRKIWQTYWRKRMPPANGPDPDRDLCGVIWCSPAVPFRGKEVRVVLKMLHKIMNSFRFEPNFGLLCVSARLIYVTASILFDREAPGEDERALKCYHEMFKELMREGYIPYRLGIQSMSSFQGMRDDSGNLLRKIKSVLDPNHILAPGRYDCNYHPD